MRPFYRIFVLTIFLSFYSQGAQAQKEINCKLLPDLFRAYLSQHIIHKSLTPELHARTMEQYVKQMDPTKMVLLQSDIVDVKKNVQKLFFGITKGDCSPLDTLQALLLKRAQETEASVRKILSDDKFKVDESASLELDPEKRNYAKNPAEREDLLKKSIHFQIWNYLSTDVPLKEAKEKLIHRYELNTKRVVERKPKDLIVSFTDAFTSALDPHTTYFSKEGSEDFTIDMSLSLEGIGASLSSNDGYTIVEEIIPGGAADRSKLLMQKDKIIAVGQTEKEVPQNVIDMDLSKVVRLIRGKKGTLVYLTLLRKEGENNKRIVVKIERDKVDLQESAARIEYYDRQISNSRKIKLAHIELPSFYGDSSEGARNSYTDIKKLLAEANEKNVDGMVLNLSRNGGGVLDGAVKISGLFIKEGAIVAVLDSRQDVNVLRDSDQQTNFSKPLVVLTSRASASASEILAGALQDYGRAIIVGADNTFGKGSVQTVMPLPADLGAMKITTGMFFVPGGKSTQNLGVSADVVLPSTLSIDEVGEKTLDNALPPLKINSFKSKNIVDTKEAPWTSVNDQIKKSLAQKSSARVSKSTDFKKILKDIEEIKNNKGVIKLSEVIEKDKKDSVKRKLDKDKSQRERIQEMQKPYVEESINVLADLVEVLNPNAGKPITISEVVNKETTKGP